MEKILKSLQDPRLIAALEANLEEEMLFFGRAVAGAEVYNDGQVEGFYTGRGHLNGILRTHITRNEAGAVQASIDAVLAYFRARQVGEIGWSIGRNCQPEDIATHLERNAFHLLEEEHAGLALDLAGLRVEDHRVAGLEIRELASNDEINTILYRLEIEGFGSSQAIASYYCEMYQNAGFGPGTSWRHFGGWLRRECVAGASLLFHAGVAGLYGVATLPAARRQGIARALVLWAIATARQEGYRIVVLSPTDMSAGIYRRLGFREYTRIRHYIRVL